MKAVVQQSNSFQPIDVAITLETQQEADALATLCNFSPVVDATLKMGLDITPVFQALLTRANGHRRIEDFGEALVRQPGMRSIK